MEAGRPTVDVGDVGCAGLDSTRPVPSPHPAKSPMTPKEDPDLLLARALQEQENMLLMLRGGPPGSMLEPEDEEEADGAEVADDAALARSLDRRERQALYNKMLEMAGFANAAQQMEEEEEVPTATDAMSYEELQMLQDAVGSVGRGLSQEAISALPCLQLADVKAQLPAAADSDMCPVCQEAYTEQDTLMLLPCQHPYHAGCITEWLQVSKQCPVCNKEVAPQGAAAAAAAAAAAEAARQWASEDDAM